MEFIKFQKIPRLNRDMMISEKLDGSNAQIGIAEDGLIYAGSRNRWLTVDNDNFGFARWVVDNTKDLLTLGPGRHFGEWWGQGIQRKYDMDHKAFSLFNIHRYSDERPECCDVVPLLYKGPFNTDTVNEILYLLKERGSFAAPGFMNPEGIVVFHVASGKTFKVTCKKDNEWKGLNA